MSLQTKAIISRYADGASDEETVASFVSIGATRDWAEKATAHLRMIRDELRAAEATIVDAKHGPLI